MTKFNWNRPQYKQEKIFPPLNIDSELKFGKYRGSTVLWIIENDTSYMEWMIDNKVVQLDNQAYKFFKQRRDSKEV